MQHPYYRSILLIERLHRFFLEVVKSELDRRSIRDVNNIQSLILYNIGGDELTVGELTARGYYLGSNVSYNVKKMVENAYLIQERSPHDRRSIRVRASEKGLALTAHLGRMFERHVGELSDVALRAEDLTEINEAMARLERFWTSRVHEIARIGA